MGSPVKHEQNLIPYCHEKFVKNTQKTNSGEKLNPYPRYQMFAPRLEWIIMKTLSKSLTILTFFVTTWPSRS